MADEYILFWKRPSHDSPWGILFRYKFFILLLVLMLLHIVLISLSEHISRTMHILIFIVVYSLGFLLIGIRSKLSQVTIFTSVAAIILATINILHDNIWLLVANFTVYTVFLSLVLICIFHHLLNEKKVSIDSVMAGVVVYLMIGSVFSQIYTIIEILQPGSFHFASEISHGLVSSATISLYYFSIVTLTTAGYGDIFPVTNLARILAAYESMVGQVYLVVFIALLMGRHFSSR